MIQPSAASCCNFKYSKAAQGPTTLVVVSALVPATAPHCSQNIRLFKFGFSSSIQHFFVFFRFPQLDVRLAKIRTEGDGDRRTRRKRQDSQGRQGPCLRCRTPKYTSAHARRPSSRGPNASITLCARVPHAQGLSQVPGRGLLGQTGQASRKKSEGGRHEEDHQVCASFRSFLL
ncbi:hypothetical protein B0H14DRAFT_3905116, partial [Mycena olivaceomarginata]